MNFLNFSYVDYLLFVLMFGISTAVGVYYGFFAKQQKTAINYLLGDKSMNYFPIAMSLVASSISGVALLAYPAEIYMHGTLYALTAIDPLIVFFIIYYVFLPVFWKLQITTAFEYLEIRFDRNFRTLASVLFTFASFFCLPIIIYAPSLAFNQVTGFNLHVIAIVMSLICIFYTTIGGLKAVVWTDTLQLLITLSTLSCVFVMGTISSGGFTTVWEIAKKGDRIEFFNLDPNPTIRNTFWTVTVGTSFTTLAIMAVNPAMVQRFLAVPNLSDSRKTLAIFAFFSAVTKIICCFSGIIIFAKYFNCDPFTAGEIKRADQILPYYVLDVAADIPGLSGLFVAGLFSTALSTLSTYLNSLAGIIYKDFVSSFMPADTKEQTASNIMKLITLVIGIISVGLVFIVERLGSILELIVTLNGATAGPILGMFMLGIFFPFANRKGTAIGVVASLLTMTFIIFKYQLHVWNGTIKYSTKPLYTDGCNTTPPLQTSFNFDQSEEIFWLYRVSFHYYILMGTVLTIMVALPISWFTNDEDFYVNPDTLCPCVNSFIGKYKAAEKKINKFNYKDVEKSHLQYEFTNKLIK